MSRDERDRAVAAVDAVLDFGKQLAQDHQRRMPVSSYDTAETVILTLFAAAHRSGGAAADLLRLRWAEEAQVLGRSVFEHVVYAHLISYDDWQRRLYIHYGPSLGRWDEIDGRLRRSSGYVTSHFLVSC